MSLSPASPYGTIYHYAAPMLSAGAAIVLPFRYLMMKSELQKGAFTPSRITLLSGVKEGMRAAPSVGIIVGLQVSSQDWIEKEIVGLGKWYTKLASSTMVGALSSLPLAIYNGYTMNQGWRDSCRNFSIKQGAAITVQEACFVLGVKGAGPVGEVMQEVFGKNAAVTYTAAFLSGGAGSLAGHFANTALTRWQAGLTVSPGQLMWGAKHKTWGVAWFALFYKLNSEFFEKRRPE